MKAEWRRKGGGAEHASQNWDAQVDVLDLAISILLGRVLFFVIQLELKKILAKIIRAFYKCFINS